MKICHGNRGMTRSKPSLYFYHRPGYDLVPPPTTEEWAWLIANQNLFHKCARRVLGERTAWMVRREVLTTIAAPALCALRNWHLDGGASKPTLTYKYVFNHLSVVARSLFVIRGGPKKGVRHPPVTAGSCDLVEILETDRVSSGTADSSLLESCMAWLDDRRRFIVESYLGAGKPQKTMQDIGDELEISRERVRQLYEDSMSTLRILYGYSGTRPDVVRNTKLPWSDHKTNWRQREYQRTYQSKRRARKKAADAGADD